MRNLFKQYKDLWYVLGIIFLITMCTPFMAHGNQAPYRQGNESRLAGMNRYIAFYAGVCRLETIFVMELSEGGVWLVFYEDSAMMVKPIIDREAENIGQGVIRNASCL